MEDIKSPAAGSCEPHEGSKYLGKMNWKSGMALFEYDIDTSTLSVVVPEKVDAMGEREGKPMQRNVVHVRPKCVYLQALNVKNAVRKIKKTYEKVILEGEIL